MSKILIVSMQVGAGHIKAAEAIEATIQNMPRPEKIIVKNVELLQHARSLMNLLYNRSYLEVVRKIPELYDYGYHHPKLAQHLLRPRFLFDRFNFADFFKLVDDFRPDLIFATHFIPAAILDQYWNRKRKKNKFKLAVTITDYAYHPFWRIERADLYTVATEEVKFNLQAAGVAEKKIAVTGIPVHLRFDEAYEGVHELDVQERFHLDPDLPLVLITGGGAGVTPADEVVEVLSEIDQPFEMMAIAGNNQDLHQRLTVLEKRTSRLKQIFSHVPFMPDLMAASDLLITKPGGMTVSEALVMGLPMVLIEPISEQEEANANYLLKQGVAVRADSLPSLVHKVSELLNNPADLVQMSEYARQIARPLAAQAVAELGLDLVDPDSD